MTIDFPRDSMRSVQDVLRTDSGPPPPGPFTETSPRSFGTDAIAVEKYISADYQRREYDRMWSRVWQWACNLEDIPNVGDHIVYDIGDRSVLVVRATENEVKAYHNACLHRGRQLKTEPGSSRQLVCGFHGWTWYLDGQLARIPCRWDFPQIRDEDVRLPEVRCETWSQFVFVNFDREAGPLREWLDVVPDHFQHFPLDDKFTAAHVQEVLPANWKIAMEAFLESYHEISTHPQLLEWNSDANTQYDVWDRANRLFTLIGVPSPHLGKVDDDAVYEAALGFYSAPGATDPPSELPAGTGAREAIAQLARNMVTGAVGVDMSGESISAVLDAVQYWVFPNWCPWASLANALQYRFRPNGDDPHSSIFDVRIMLPAPPGGSRPPAAPVHRLADDEPWSNAPELMGFAQIMQQDEANLRAIQRGLRATVQRGLNFAEHQESRIRHFHELLDGYLHDDDDATMRTQE